MTSPARSHTVIIGAGIVGLTTAERLLRAGHRVTVVDREPGPAAGASAQNGAQLSYAYVAPLASPGLWWQLPGLLLSPDSPLRFSAAGAAGALGWSLRFLSACRAAEAERTTHALLGLAALSRQRLHAWLNGVDTKALAHRRNGKLVVYADAGGFGGAARQVALQARLGGPRQELLGSAACREREPALNGSRSPIAGGVWTPDEEVVDCRAVCDALAAQLSAHPDARLLWGHEVIGFETSRGNRPDRIAAVRVRASGGVETPVSADTVVVSAGAQVARLLSPLGVALPIAPLKGYSIDVDRAALERFPTASLTDSARRIVFAPLRHAGHERLRVAGMAELVGHDLRIDPRRLAALREAADRWFGLRPQAAGGGIHRPWAGLRPATPTGLPCIGRFGRFRNLYANAGHGALGLTLAFGAAELLAASMADQPAAVDRAPFSRGALVPA